MSSIGARTTSLEVVDRIDLDGKHAIVTGGHSGIGLQTALALAATGATVTVLARLPEQASSAIDHILDVESFIDHSPAGRVHYSYHRSGSSKNDQTPF